MLKKIQQYGQRLLSPTAKRRVLRLFRWPPVGFVYKGSLRRLNPISSEWGFDRGRPIDRYYIEAFLKQYQSDIKGHVLEVGTNRFTREFGDDRVIESSVLHVSEQKDVVTVIADLTEPNSLPENAFDCIIITQTLNAIFELDAAIANIYRALKPGGIALVTVPGISKISRYDMDKWGYYWAFTSLSIQKLFERHFPEEGVSVASYGNVLSAISFLHGLAQSEMRSQELEYNDPDYQVVIALRAVKLGQSVALE